MAEYVGGRESGGQAQREKDPSSADIQRYKEILSREPSSLVFAALAEAYRKMDLFDQAIETCKKGLRSHPNFVSGRVALARAYMGAGHSDLALKELEKVVHAVPENIVAQKLLARIYREKSDVDKLEGTLHRILALDISDETAKKELAQLHEANGRQESVSSSLKQRKEIVTKTLAEIYASQGCYEKAFDIYQRLSWEEPGIPAFHERLADLKEKILHRAPRIKTREETDDGPSMGSHPDVPSLPVDQEATREQKR